MDSRQRATLEAMILAVAKLLLIIAMSALFIGWSIKIQASQEYIICADGWASPSIGRSGACSYHGGEVEVTIDKRTPTEKAVCSHLFTWGTILLVVALVFGYKTHINSVRRSREEKDRKTGAEKKQQEWMISLTTDLSGGFALVPLSINGVTRLVRVKRTSQYGAETVEKVAVWQPAEHPDRTYSGKVYLTFVSRHGPYYPSLVGYVSPEHQGKVEEINWSDECSSEIFTGDMPREDAWGPGISQINSR